MENIIVKPHDYLESFDVKEYISNFQIELFSNCPASYYYFYAMQQEKGGNAVTTFGDCIHTTIEKIGNTAIQKYNGIIAQISFQHVMETFREIVTAFPGIITTDNMDRAKRHLLYWHDQCIERRARVLAVEIPFHICLQNGIFVKGFIDWEETNKFTGENESQFADWKTGFVSKDHTKQMTLYKIAGLFLRPDKKITTVLHEFENETFYVYDIVKEDMDSYYEYIELMKNSINLFVDNVNKAKETGKKEELLKYLNSVAKTHIYCYSCPGNLKCSVYQNELYAFTDLDVDTFDINDIVEKDKKAKNVEKWAKNTHERLKKIIVDNLLRNDLMPISLENGEFINPSTRTTKHISTQEVIPLLIDRGFADRLTISSKRLQEVSLALNESDNQFIKDNTRSHVGEPSYKISKKPKALKK